MKKIILSIIMLLLCLNIKAQVFNNQSYSIYVQKYDSLSIELMWKYKIPASVIMSISMLESANGTSKLSKNSHNFFGIKNSKGIYKTYNSDLESFIDFCNLITENRIYKKDVDYLINNYIFDYKIWLDRIASKGYSETKEWTDRLIVIIKKHRLYEYDLCFI